MRRYPMLCVLALMSFARHDRLCRLRLRRRGVQDRRISADGSAIALEDYSPSALSTRDISATYTGYRHHQRARPCPARVRQ